SVSLNGPAAGLLARHRPERRLPGPRPASGINRPVRLTALGTPRNSTAFPILQPKRPAPCVLQPSEPSHAAQGYAIVTVTVLRYPAPHAPVPPHQTSAAR